ncbi:hypothetical protein [Saccharomonospora iraqiensis]|uniref:hypothetical protein n=1 Tax=Saccharomonospora iraqiensis TaxID=52698 RepID=UPI000414292B|nr:hypothetical protein [Saccharomonospora iraqiensis]
MNAWPRPSGRTEAAVRIQTQPGTTVTETQPGSTVTQTVTATDTVTETVTKSKGKDKCPDKGKHKSCDDDGAANAVARYPFPRR